jgi:hypothetical protein
MKFKDFGLKATCQHCNGTGKSLDHTQIGKWVQHYRVLSSKTLKQVSQASHLSISYLSDLEHGRRNWCEDLFDIVCGAIGEGK